MLLLPAAHIVGDLVHGEDAPVLPGCAVTDPHEPSDACHREHCYSCNVDEPGTGYIVCPECFHVYRTARELRRAYRRASWRLHRTPMPLPDFADDRGPRWGRLLWHLATVRARNINFCQHCIHDF